MKTLFYIVERNDLTTPPDQPTYVADMENTPRNSDYVEYDNKNYIVRGVKWFPATNPSGVAIFMQKTWTP